jgi:regulator of RNase E activity RraA
VHPSAILDVIVVEVNGPVRIGNATVMPGDVVLGAREGVTFVPPHLAEEVVGRSEDVRQRDVFGKSRIAEGIYTSGQIDVSTWADEIEADYASWCAEMGLGANPRP